MLLAETLPGRAAPQGDVEGARYGPSMLLSDRDLKVALAAGRMGLAPYDEAMIQPSSIDARLDRYFRVFANHRHSHIDPAVAQDDLTELLEPEGEEPFILHPGEFVLVPVDPYVLGIWLGDGTTTSTTILGDEHIPQHYLTAGFEQRLALLPGLMDSDGYVDEVGRCEFVSILEHEGDARRG